MLANGKSLNPVTAISLADLHHVLLQGPHRDHGKGVVVGDEHVRPVRAIESRRDKGGDGPSRSKSVQECGEVNSCRKPPWL
jgi:hypothetical protein